MSAALECAQQLVNLRSASDFLKLSSTHARIQIELMIKQSSELRSLAMNLTPYDTHTAADPQVLTKSTDRVERVGSERDDDSKKVITL